MKKVILTILCILFGPFIAWRGVSDLIKGARSKSWPTVQGTVQSTSLTQSRGRRSGTTYTPVVKYDYEVAGTAYSGDRVDNGDRGTSSMDDAMTTLGRYREGQTVTVHYDPKEPSASLLEVGTTGGNWFMLVAGFAMTGGGVLAGRSYWQKLQSNDFAPSSGF